MKTSPTHAPQRQDYASYGSWEKQTKRYIDANAPKASRIFIRDTKTPKRWHRWVLAILPLSFGVIGLWSAFFIYSEYKAASESGTRTNLVVTDTYESPTKSGQNTKRLRVDLNGQSVDVKGSYYNEQTKDIQIGDTIDVYYSTESDTPTVFWPDDSMVGGSIMLGVIGGAISLGALWLAFRFRGTVEPGYMQRALGELEAGRPLPLE